MNRSHYGKILALFILDIKSHPKMKQYSSPGSPVPVVFGLKRDCFVVLTIVQVRGEVQGWSANQHRYLCLAALSNLTGVANGKEYFALHTQLWKFIQF